MFKKNVYYLILGVVLGAVLGAFICDNTKKRIAKAIYNKTKRLLSGVKSSSKKAEEAITSVKNAVRGLG